MTTHETVLYQNNLIFIVVGDERESTDVYDFIRDNVSEDERKQILGTLGAMNISLTRYCNRVKFKHVEGKIYELKQFQIRIACYWRDSRTLVAFMAFRKKKDKWKKSELERARTLLRECQENEMARKKRK